MSGHKTYFIGYGDEVFNIDFQWWIIEVAEIALHARIVFGKVIDVFYIVGHSHKTTIHQSYCAIGIAIAERFKETIVQQFGD